jgi:protein involved in polysaccharide export with SLBB domain
MPQTDAAPIRPLARPGPQSFCAALLPLLIACAGSVLAQGVPPVTPLAPPLAASAAGRTTAEGMAAPVAGQLPAGAVRRSSSGAMGADGDSANVNSSLAADEPADFERWATEANGGKPVWRFGRHLRRSEPGRAALDTPARVPPEYRIQVGDEISITAWGSIESASRQRVDRAGRITLPRVGPVAVAGARAAELEALVRARLERVFKGFDVSAAVTELSPVRVRVTGFVERPGDYVVPPLSTISAALAQALGPTAGGSYRRIRLVRAGRTELTFDWYSLLEAGNPNQDVLLQPDDVLHVLPVGPQAAMLGPVNRPAVFEILPGATVADLLQLAGGLSSVADRERLVLERLRDRHRVGAVELLLPRDLGLPLGDGDLLRAISLLGPAQPSQVRNKRVRVDGEVLRPGDYLLPPNATLSDAVQAAGGLTPAAYVFGTELRRERTRLTQEANYERAIQELEAEANRTAILQNNSDEGRRGATESAARQLLARLRVRKPEGRIVLDLTPQSAELPPLELEDGDQVRLPPRGQSVGVFGSVINAGSFVHDSARDIGHYLRRAGGATPAADDRGAFVVRANGSVVSAREGRSWGAMARFESEKALPGDTVFVPEKLDRTTWVQAAKDWTQILYQFGIGVAALKVVK